MFSRNVKLGVWIIQVEVKAIVVVLDSELFSCRYTQTQYYTLTTPAGSCGSKNERPNNTHLNLGGTQMSPSLSWTAPGLVTSSFWSCVSRRFVYLFCVVNSVVCLSCDTRSPPGMVEIRPQGPREPAQKKTKKQHLLVCNSAIYGLPSLIYPLRVSWKFKKASKGEDFCVVRMGCYLCCWLGHWLGSHYRQRLARPQSIHVHWHHIHKRMHQLLRLCVINILL